MATREEIELALRNADAAGDTEAAKTLAAHLQSMPVATPPTDVKSQFDALPFYMKPVQATGDILRLAANGGSFGLADKYAHLLGGGTPGEERQKTADAATRAGIAGTVAQVGGSMINPLSRLGKGVTGVLGSGALTGGIDAFGHDTNIAEGAGLGALFSMLGLGAGKVVGKVVGKLSPRPIRPSTEDMRGAKDSVYKAADDAGVALKPGATARISRAVATAAQDAYPVLHPKTLATLDKVTQMIDPPVSVLGKPVAGARTLTDIDAARKYIGKNLARNPDPAEASYGHDMISALDNELNNITAADVVAGDPQKGVELLNKARDLNSRFNKMRTLDEITMKAERSAARTPRGDIDKATRGKIDQLLGNRKAVRGFTEDEQAALDNIVRGTRAQNLLSQVGTLSPGGSMGGMGLKLGGPAAVGGILGGPAGALTAAGITGGLGFMAKKAADRGSQKAIDDLYDLVAAGGKRSNMKRQTNALERLAKSDEFARIMTQLGVQQ